MSAKPIFKINKMYLVFSKAMKDQTAGRSHLSHDKQAGPHKPD